MVKVFQAIRNSLRPSTACAVQSYINAYVLLSTINNSLVFLNTNFES